MSNSFMACRRLEGKIALITASTAGIGLGIAIRLGEEGARVVVSSRRQENVDAVVQQLCKRGLDVIGKACHVGDALQVQKLVKYAVDTWGRVDILVSNAAVNPSAGPILEMEDGVVDKIFDINGAKN